MTDRPVLAVAGIPPAGQMPTVHDFHDELRRKNVPVLLWSAVVFNIAYVAWTVFDYFLAKEYWQFFLGLRLIASAINTVVAIVVLKPRLNRYTWEAFWIWLFVFGLFIAPMLTMVGETSFVAYVMGFTIIIYGAGLLPFWHPRWALTCIVSVLALVPIALLSHSPHVSSNTIIGGSFFIATAAALSAFMAWFKYSLARRDFFTRAELQAVVQSEKEARRGLARATENLETALSQLREHDRLKSQFFANISHELRTPLTLILAPLESLLDNPAARPVRSQMRVIRRNAERLLRLIDDLLDLSKLDAGGLRLNAAELDVRSIAFSVYENSGPAALARSIDLRYAADSATAPIHGDAHRLEIVLTNLVGNALKYTPEGGRVEIRVRDLEHGVEIEVADTGFGIPREDLPHVFERFFQVSPKERRQQGGVGIGLALAKELVELHGGRVEVDSHVGEGTTFRVFLPFGTDHIRPEVLEKRQEFRQVTTYGRRAGDPEADAEPTALAAAAKGADLDVGEMPLKLHGSEPARIVLAEDNGELRGFIESLLRRHFTVWSAEDGRQAWELIQRERPDLVLSDIMMPGRTGTELCRDIKLDPALRTTPVILLTARVGSEATLEGYAHGADDFVVKPFHPRVLLARVYAQLKLRRLGLRLAEQEKLAVVGTMAAGILHEVRNPINAIINASRVLAEGKAKGDTALRLIDIVKDGAERVRSITDALDRHARPAEQGATTPCDLQEGIEATLRLLEFRLDDVSVHRAYDTDRRALAPAGPLNQVVLNLMDNALRAGAQNLWIGVEAAGDRVRVRIADDGSGIPPEVAQRIFDPFFTTRQPGEGTGLGLYLSRQIVEQAGGSLTVAQREAGGSEFVIDLPGVEAARATQVGIH